MPPSTIPSTSSAISSPGRRFGSSDQRRRRNGAARPPRHDDSQLAPVFRLERLNLTVPARGFEPWAAGDGHTAPSHPHLPAVKIIEHHNFIWSDLIAPGGAVHVAKCKAL